VFVAMTLRPAWIEVDLDAIEHNVGAIRERLSKGARYLAVVKANAYGHGDVEVAKAALNAGAEWLGVILVAEGRRLREAGIDAPILLLHEPHPEDVDDAVTFALTPCVFTERGIAALDEAAERARRTVPVHLKIDTGLNRLGVPVPHIDEVATALAKASHLDVQGVFSHFAFADQPGHPFIDSQLEKFAQARDALRRRGVEPELVHIGNSAAALTRPDAHFDLVRVGVATYGLAPGPSLRDAMAYAPALSLKARAAMVKRVPRGEGVSYGLRYTLERDSTIVSLPLGYADGWPRHATGATRALVGGVSCPVVGTICMDSFMVDAGDAECEVGDEVVLIGAQGEARITADDVAEATNTINYEVTTRLSSRLPRVYTRARG
jgi:alanine racemase